MNIFWITPECPYPPNTGGRVGIWKRIEYMAKDNDIYLYSICDDMHDLSYMKDMEKYCKSIKMYDRQRNIMSVFASLFIPYPAISRWNKKLKIDLKDDYKKIKPEFVIVDFPQMIGVIPNQILSLGNVVLNQHNIEFQSLKSLSSGLDAGKKLIYRFVAKQMEWYESRIYRQMDIKLYTFVSSQDKKYFEQRYKKKNTFLVPVGAEINMASQMIENCHNMIFVANMAYSANEAGALWLINAIYPKVKERVHDVKLYLVGKNPREKLYKAVENNKDIIITGTVDSLSEYYDKCNVAVVPIMAGGGVNVKLLEALGEGKLVVTTSKGVEGTEFRDGYHVRISNNEEDFVEACVDLLLNPFSEKNRKMKGYVQKLMSEKYSWSAVTREFEFKLEEMKNQKG